MAALPDDSVGSKTKFMFELSEEVKALRQELAASKKRQDDLEAWIQGDLSSSLSSLQSRVKGLETAVDTLRTETASVKESTAALTRWRDERIGKELEGLAPQVATLFRAMEQKHAEEAKLREQGLWEVFARKAESERNAAARDRETAAQQWATQFAEHRNQIKTTLDTELAELQAATRSLKDGAKTLARVDSASKRNDAQLEKIELEIQRLDETKAQVQQAMQRLAEEARARIAPEKEQQTFSRLTSTLEEDRRCMLEASTKFENDRKALLQSLANDFAATRQEIAKSVREELSKRITEEFRWHGLTPSEEERQKAREAAGAGPERSSDEPSPVAQWLKRVGLPEYAQAFADGGFEFLYVVALLDEHDLDAMNITTIGHRRILLAAAKQLAVEVEMAAIEAEAN
eukprot:m51a1_g11853 hypothetical protein (404) ;mRNA; f:493532-494885